MTSVSGTSSLGRADTSTNNGSSQSVNPGERPPSLSTTDTYSSQEMRDLQNLLKEAATANNSTASTTYAARYANAFDRPGTADDRSVVEQIAKDLLGSGVSTNSVDVALHELMKTMGYSESDIKEGFDNARASTGR